MIEEVEFRGKTMEEAWRALDAEVRRRGVPQFTIVARDYPVNRPTGVTPARLVIVIPGPV